MSKSRKTFDSIGETCFDRLRISHHSSHADSDYEPDSEADINTDSDTSLDLELESKLAKIKTSRRSSTCSVHQYACSVAGCFAIFTKRYRLDRHQRKHSGEKPFICDVEGCEKAFTCRSYLNKHLKRPHHASNQSDSSFTPAKSVKLFSCPECDLKFKHKFTLKVHSATHSGELPFRCGVCDKAFAIKSRLRKHEKRHQGYDCGHDSCTFQAPTWSSLRKHVRLEHRFVHKCLECDKTFASNYSLLTHAKIHSGEKLICPYDNCNRSYVKKSNLNSHLKTHTTERFVCPFSNCKKQFKHKNSLINHQKSVHSSCNDTNANKEKSIRKKLNVVAKRVSLASIISGYQPPSAKLKAILDKDKQFRQLIVT